MYVYGLVIAFVLL